MSPRVLMNCGRARWRWPALGREKNLLVMCDRGAGSSWSHDLRPLLEELVRPDGAADVLARGRAGGAGRGPVGHSEMMSERRTRGARRSLRRIVGAWLDDRASGAVYSRRAAAGRLPDAVESKISPPPDASSSDVAPSPWSPGPGQHADRGPAAVDRTVLGSTRAGAWGRAATARELRRTSSNTSSEELTGRSHPRCPASPPLGRYDERRARPAWSSSRSPARNPCSAAPPSWQAHSAGRSCCSAVVTTTPTASTRRVRRDWPGLR